MTPDQSLTTQLALMMAASSIMRKGDFNTEVAINSLIIFKNTSEDDKLTEAAETVLEALDDLTGLGIEDRRNRAWQDQKLVVQETFRHLYGSYSKSGIDPIVIWGGDQALGNH